MATAQEAIKRLRYVFTAEGADQVAAALNKVGTAQGNVAATSAQTEKASLSLDRQFANIERRFNTGVRAQQDYEKVQRQVNAALAQNPALQARANEVLALAADHFGKASGFGYAFKNALSGVQGQMIALSAGAGPVGTFLAALGPWGVAAAVAVGGAAAAFGKLSEMATGYATKARELRDFSESTGLAITQLKALDLIGARVGVSSDRVAQGIEGMTSRLVEFRDGEGKAFDLLYKYNQGLAIQLMSARSTADAIKLLSQAFIGLDVAQQNSLGRALGFGKSPGDMIRVLSAAQGNPLDANVDEAKLARVAKLQIEIEESSKRSRAAIAGLWSEEILNIQKQEADVLDRMAQRMKDMKESAGGSWWTDFWIKVGQALGDQQMTGAGPQPGERAGRSLPGISMRSITERVGVGQNFGTTGRFGLGDVQTSVFGNEKTAQGTLNLWLKQNAALGSSMTLTEQYTQEVLKLNAAQEKDGFSSTTRSRALAAFNLAQRQAIEQTRERLGVATEEQIVTARLEELDNLRAKGFIKNASDMALAERIIRKEAKETAEALQVRASALPQLQSFIFESGNLNKQLDSLSVSGLNSVTSGLADITTGTKSAKQGFIDLGATVLRSLEEMIIKMTITLPLANALKSALGSFLGGPTMVTGANGPLATPTFNARGNIFESSNIVPFARGGVVSSPTIFPFASGVGLMGEAGPEAVMPLRRGSDGRLGVSSPSSGGGTIINLHNYSGGEIKTQDRGAAPDGRKMIDIVIGEVKKDAAKGGFDKALSGRFGLKPTTARV